MTVRFTRLTRKAIRSLRPGERITEHGIIAERLANGDTKYSVAVMIDGQRVHRVIGRESSGVTRSQAEEFIAKARSDAMAGRLNLPKGRKLPLTFERAAAVYMTKLKETGGKDISNNESHLRLHLSPFLGGMRLDQISTFTLAKFRKDRRRAGFDDSTINRILATYRRMGRKLLEWDVIEKPFPAVKLEREDNQRDHVISVTEEAALIDAALNDVNTYVWLFIKFGMATSLRHSEMLGARFDNMNADRRRLRVKVKGGSWRNQPLTRSITDILMREREMADDPDGWIFPSSLTASGHVDSMKKAFRRCVTRAGLDPTIITPHIMRHSSITRLAEAGASIKTIQSFSGHESVDMVMRYAHAQDQAIDSALDRMEGGTVVEHPARRKGKRS
jgi:integrase